MWCCNGELTVVSLVPGVGLKGVNQPLPQILEQQKQSRKQK